MRLALTIAAFAASALAGLATAHEFTAGTLTVGHPYALETAPTAKSAAGYFSVTNGGATGDRLVAVRAAFPAVELHTTETDAAGVTKMLPVEGLDIPAGGTVTLAPRGVHVMFMGLTAPWAAGDHVEATLVFEKAGEVPIVFNVEPRKPAAEGADDHGGTHH